MSLFRGLKFSEIEGLSIVGIGFLFPKKAVGLGARDVGRTLGVDLGLEVALGFPVGLKELAAGFGLNSEALTLNLAEEAAEVGVRTLLDPCEDEFCGGLTVGLDPFLGPLWIGSGVGTLTGSPPLYNRWLSSKRRPSRP